MTLRPLCPLLLFFCTDPGAADQRLPFATPAEAGMSAEKLGKIDEIVARTAGEMLVPEQVPEMALL